ncbi:MAG: universal stress protein [Geminicoccaceae bacterium]|nr:MAG: universal stress protein [Geminicoccaceae bacterium]
MFEKALVAVDLSPAQDALLAHLEDLQGWGVQHLVLAHVIPLGYVAGAGFAQPEEFRGWLEERAAPLRRAGLLVTTSVSTTGLVADELSSVAALEGASLVVVGSRSHNLLYELFLGGVAQELLRQATLPVLIVRLGVNGHAVPLELDRVLLATDLSDASKGAEETALGLAPKAARIDCLTVLPGTPSDEDRVALERAHADLVQRIAAAGGKATSRIEDGDVDAHLADAAAAGYSLVIVGKHGQNWLEGKLIGTTAAKLCETSKLPVLMVPTPKR